MISLSQNVSFVGLEDEAHTIHICKSRQVSRDLSKKKPSQAIVNMELVLLC